MGQTVHPHLEVKHKEKYGWELEAEFWGDRDSNLFNMLTGEDKLFSLRGAPKDLGPELEGKIKATTGAHMVSFLTGKEVEKVLLAYVRKFGQKRLPRGFIAIYAALKAYATTGAVESRLVFWFTK